MAQGWFVASCAARTRNEKFNVFNALKCIQVHPLLRHTHQGQTLHRCLSSLGVLCIVFEFASELILWRALRRIARTRIEPYIYVYIPTSWRVGKLVV